MNKTSKTCTKCNIEKNLDQFKGNICIECIRASAREYSRKYRKENADKVRESNNKYNAEHREQIRERDRRKLANKITGDRIRERARNNQKIYQQDPNIRIMANTRKRISSMLKSSGQIKHAKTQELIGCTAQFLKKWLEYQFDSNMTWENYGTYWHVDHVKPIVAFRDVDDLEKQKQCLNWKNLRPLEASKNISKGNKILNRDILNQEIKVKYYLTLKL